jgi:uncharacterized phage protein (TIGR02218 family)
MTDTLTTRVHAWRVERRDGIAIGFTAHDRDLWRAGLHYRAAPGLIPGAVVQALGSEADSVAVDAVLSDDAITAADLAAGRWDGAAVTLFLIDWTDPEGDVWPLLAGTLGEVEAGGDGFRAELRGGAARLDEPFLPHVSPGCRAGFCDADCQLPAARFTHRARLVSAEGLLLRFDALPAIGIDGFAHGLLRWRDGPDCGTVQGIAASDGATVTLTEPPARPPRPGAGAELIEGCDRRLATCAGRFANVRNFRGEPYLPGNDLLTRYPGGA